ncbi:MAG: DUF1549 domain-containing protein, partial [Planctomycetes bacterium]|nr:DUF1549 domain-containing protein [Planctomycetota bacterium]
MSFSADAAEPPSFEADIAPLFKLKCWSCHGDDERKAELDLRTAASLLKGGDSGPAVTGKDAEQSLLYEKVVSGEMPPAKKDRLTEKELETIRLWIESGEAMTAAGPVGEEVTQHEIIPILLRRCTVCHGARQRAGGLDLRSRDALLRGGKSGPAIVPGKPDESLLIQKIRAGEMPPITRLIEVSIKPIEPQETDLLVKWISNGAPAGDVTADVATTSPDPLVTDRDREFWSFQKPRVYAPPQVSQPNRVRNPVDAFILAELEKHGLSFSPEADRAVLLRRVTYDLTGLPPEPAERAAFLNDQRPDAYERLVDRLLDSPRYGERWARHWLDVAGYSDSEGKREQDVPRAFAWRYRDYVIRACNSDKPYDRFLIEQIAGDELADYEHAPEITEEMYWNLVATGFLRMAPDPTWYNLTNFVPDRLDVMADEIDVFGSAVLGLTLKCARCHSHKFDPIPHRDYYRLVDVFKGAFDEHDWMKSNWHNGLSHGERSDRDLPFVSTRERREWEAHNGKLQSEIAQLQTGLEEQVRSAISKIEAERLAAVPEALRGDLSKALETAADQRNAVQKYLVEKFEKSVRITRDELLKSDAALKQRADETAKRVAQL